VIDGLSATISTFCMSQLIDNAASQ